MATLKLFIARDTWAPGGDVARRAGVPSHALSSNCMTVLAQAITKAEVKQMLIDYGITEGRADTLVKEMRLHKDRFLPGDVDSLRKIGLMEGHGVWTYYNFIKDSRIFQLTEQGPQHVADVQLWPLEDRINVEPVNTTEYRLHWRSDNTAFSRHTGFLNGLPLFWLDGGSTVRTDLPGWSHRRWECGSRAEAYALADRLLGQFVTRLGASFDPR